MEGLLISKFWNSALLITRVLAGQNFGAVSEAGVALWFIQLSWIQTTMLSTAAHQEVSSCKVTGSKLPWKKLQKTCSARGSRHHTHATCHHKRKKHCRTSQQPCPAAIHLYISANVFVHNIHTCERVFLICKTVLQQRYKNWSKIKSKLQPVSSQEMGPWLQDASAQEVRLWAFFLSWDCQLKVTSES